jgi:hypothetical protein
MATRRIDKTGCAILMATSPILRSTSTASSTTAGRPATTRTMRFSSSTLSNCSEGNLSTASDGAPVVWSWGWSDAAQRTALRLSINLTVHTQGRRGVW